MPFPKVSISMQDIGSASGSKYNKIIRSLEWKPGFEVNDASIHLQMIRLSVNLEISLSSACTVQDINQTNKAYN